MPAVPFPMHWSGLARISVPNNPNNSTSHTVSNDWLAHTGLRGGATGDFLTTQTADDAAETQGGESASNAFSQHTPFAGFYPESETGSDGRPINDPFREAYIAEGVLSPSSRVDTPESWRKPSENSTSTKPVSLENVTPRSNGFLSSDSPRASSSPARHQRQNVRSKNDSQTTDSRKKTKAGLKIISENMRGRGSQNILASVKWHKIAEDMRTDKIGVMCVQETHLIDEHIELLHNQYNHLHIVNSESPVNPTGAGGVALVFNKLLTNTKDIETFEIIPGRALVACQNWHRGDKLTILGIYAPTDRVENDNFWSKIRSKLKEKPRKIPKPDMMIGDFNCVEDPIDRFPAKLSRIDAPASLDALKKYLKLSDGWRITNPDRVEWSWRKADRSSMSRIDRIYLTRELLQTSRNWSIEVSKLNANDHSRIGTVIVNLDVPEVGEGCWTMRDYLTKDERFISAASEKGKEAFNAMKNINPAERSESNNAQLIWRDFKNDIVKIAKSRSTEINCARNARLEEKSKAQREAVEALAKCSSDSERQNKKKDLRKIEDELFHLQDKTMNATFFNRRVKARVEAETMSKAWFGWTKDSRTRDTMFAMRKPDSDPAEFVTATKAMAEVAKDYHDKLQSHGLGEDEIEHDLATEEVLQHLERPLSSEEKKDLDSPIARDDIAEAIRIAPNNSAAGVDGIIYEFWNALCSRFKKSKKSKSPSFDCVGALKMVFEDSETHGVYETSNFADGWMCPLYKKGERSEISNYRPITLLNMDYKIYTKILAIRLAMVAPKLIHRSQAGFVKGRSITDHIKITSLMLSYAEATEEDGVKPTVPRGFGCKDSRTLKH